MQQYQLEYIMKLKETDIILLLQVFLFLHFLSIYKSIQLEVLEYKSHRKNTKYFAYRLISFISAYLLTSGIIIIYFFADSGIFEIDRYKRFIFQLWNSCVHHSLSKIFLQSIITYKKPLLLNNLQRSLS